MSATIKLLKLAYHPSTPEQEAIVAFLKARKGVDQDLKVFTCIDVQPKSYYHYDIKTPKHTAGWKLTVPVRSIPNLINILDSFDSEVPNYYSLKTVSETWKVIGSVELKLKVYFNTSIEKERFVKYFDINFDII